MCGIQSTIDYIILLFFAVTLETDTPLLTISANNQTEVELRCEMLDYIRPDEDLQWYDLDQQPIVSGTNRHTITYRDGTPDTAQNGEPFLITSRVAVLTISDPQVSDSGTYICIVQGTREALSAELIVTGMLFYEVLVIVTTRCRLAKTVNNHYYDNLHETAKCCFNIHSYHGMLI